MIAKIHCAVGRAWGMMMVCLLAPVAKRGHSCLSHVESSVGIERAFVNISFFQIFNVHGLLSRQQQQRRNGSKQTRLRGCSGCVEPRWAGTWGMDGYCGPLAACLGRSSGWFVAVSSARVCNSRVGAPSGCRWLGFSRPMLAGEAPVGATEASEQLKRVG